MKTKPLSVEGHLVCQVLHTPRSEGVAVLCPARSAAPTWNGRFENTSAAVGRMQTGAVQAAELRAEPLPDSQTLSQRPGPGVRTHSYSQRRNRRRPSDQVPQGGH